MVTGGAQSLYILSTRNFNILIAGGIVAFMHI